MKCQSLLKYLISNAMLSILIVGACATHQATAVPNSIDEMQDFIKKHAVTHDAVVEYEKYARLFEHLLEQFLSRSNNSSVAAHIANINKALHDFQKNMVTNARYASVHEATQHLHDRFSKLVVVMETHKRSNAITFLRALEPFLDCVPRNVRTKYSNPI